MPSPSPVAVIYHAKCPDGFGAAFAAWLRLGDSATYIPAFYGQPSPELREHTVYVLDFSFPPDELKLLEERAERVVLLDHHLSAQRQLHRFVCCKTHSFLHFDMEHSGAYLAWQHFHPAAPVPDLIRYIEDRDLWRWKLPATRPFLMQLDMLDYDFQAWKEVLELSSAGVAAFIADGEKMVAKYDSLCRGLAEDALPLRLGSHAGLMLPLGGEMVSAVGSLLAERCGSFAAVWKLLPEGKVKVSLRSVPGFDLLPLAQAFGGGGHPTSASFSLPLDRLPELVSGALALPA